MTLTESIKKIGHNIQAFRQANLDRRARIKKVKQKIQATEAGTAPEQMDKEASDLSIRYGVTYQEALDYIKSERASQKRKESLLKIAGSLGEIGQAAKESNARRMQEDQGLAFEQSDITKSRMPKRFFR